MSKNVAVFVDVANIFYAAKAAGVDIDYVTLLKSATANRDLVRAYAYTGLDPENENQRNFHSFLARSGYRVVSKDIRKYGDGKVKANLDIELVVDMMKTARNLDIAIVVSGDGDFAPAIRAVQEQGVRVEVISFRGNTSSDLMDVADLFTDITHLAKVEKGSSRSGRRVAGDEEDLSMTEVPDKQTEGTGAGRGRGRGRERTRTRDVEPVARGGRTGGRREPAAVVTSSGAPLVVLPGEKLSRVAPAEAPAAPAALGVVDEEAADAATPEEAVAAFGGADTELDENGERRRRRRRGGRGRGRGRGRGEGGEPGEAGGAGEPGETGTPPRVAAGPMDADDEAEAEYAAAAAPRGPRTTPFGSVWDVQLGVPTAATNTPGLASAADDEDFDEPEIPEYLIAEQRRNRGGQGQRPGQGGNRGGRGGGARAGYAAAVDRERYGRGGGGGINRYPDVSARERQAREAGYGRQERTERPDRPVRTERQPTRSSSSGDPWSEVPPEIEEMLRAQLASSRPAGAPQADRARDARRPAVEATEVETASPTEAATAEAAPKRRAPRRPKAAAPAEADTVTAESGADGTVVADAPDAAPKRRTTRRTTKAAASDAGAVTGETSGAAEPSETAVAAPKRRTTRRTVAADADAGPAEAPAEGTPKRRTTRRKATDADTATG